MLEIPLEIFKPRDLYLFDFYSSVIIKNDTVIDVGANVGLHTTKLLKLVGSRGHVVAVEPIKSLASDLTKYQFLHGPKLTIVNAVAGETIGNVNFVEHINKAGSHVQNFGYSDEVGTVSLIESITIDSLNLAPRFIKIDTEGYERNVILGCVETIEKHRPYLAIETNSNTKEFFIDFFKNRNYSIIDQQGFDLCLVPDTIK